ncbi:AraC-like DNA-binding protein/mannose-6-phosphate isomerase-like protein (cupin superfamily) [Chryseobacterium sp. H1D6B]|uniref:helix-turn-helix domain-containing protein n=1 Tax=Chryseobacterium sp. H1D6B TaxID=2940588 RepID=UPI0015C6DC54|nr:AraC family transcriptional regulator [Chryseobacterium sp. H1D6B]MDH6253751.1 AraC-like DNA-binding protein/mannose-6-phosphate isomerase-like protein (cupin superfamily) [Chryseobacterium sp. H1D6B]
MQNDKIKCGLAEQNDSRFVDTIEKEAYVWYEKDWKHDDYEHVHHRAQLTYVEEGYQYFHIDQKIYLVPQHHVIWIPSGKPHRITSEAQTVNLMVFLFKSVLKEDFYQHVQVFAIPPVLKEMLLYASKWNKVLAEDEEQEIFFKAILKSLPNFCRENNHLEIPVPADERLIPVCTYINANFKYHLNIDALADKAQMSVRSLQRIFKHETGITLQKYLQLTRILKSIELLDTRQYTLSQTAFMTGYKSLSAFTSSYFAVMKSKPKLKK